MVSFCKRASVRYSCSHALSLVLIIHFLDHLCSGTLQVNSFILHFADAVLFGFTLPSLLRVPMTGLKDLFNGTGNSDKQVYILVCTTYCIHVCATMAIAVIVTCR